MAKKLDPQVQAIIDNINKSDAPEYCDMTPEEARASHNEKAPLLGAPFVDVGSVKDFEVQGSNDPIPVRFYRPLVASEPTPTMVFYHGGGHVVGSLDSYDTMCRQLCAQSGVGVLSVDYRMGPEHKFPAAVEDAFDVYRWAVTQGREFGIDNAKLSLGGDSAGGNLAAVVAILARDEGLTAPLHQLLVYPATAAYPDSGSQLEFAEGHVLTRRLILWFHDHYLDYSKGDHTDFRWAPLLAESLAGLPPATLILAECDPLRDEGIAYAKRLAESGNDVTLKVFSGTTHPFFSWSGVVDKAKAALGFAAAEVKTALA